MLVDCHMHTRLCGHARGEPADYVRAAAARGIGLVTITDHVPMDDDARFRGERIRMDRSRLPEYRRLVAEAADLGRSLGVEVLYGIEAEIYPEARALEAMDEILREEPFDFVLGSLHHQLPGHKQWRKDHGIFGQDDATVEAYFAQLADGARSGRYHSIAHPDIIRSYGGVSSFDPARHEAAIRAFLEACRDAGVCLEVNTSGLIKEQHLVHPHPHILDWVGEYGIPLTLGSDAHTPAQVGQHFPDVLKMLHAKGFQSITCYREGEHVQVPIEV
jgi:histidinol-phosphatase (PHP family)